MKPYFRPAVSTAIATVGAIVAATVPAPFSPLLAQPAITVYNQNFGVVRDTVPLDLKPGVNEIRFADTTACLEPDSVILRDPAGKIALRILEQNYRNDPVTQELLLSVHEGQTIDFQTVTAEGEKKTFPGKIIRSGYAAHAQAAMQRYGQRYAMTQMGMAGSGAGQPIIEVDGKLQFGLPGQPIFPALADDSLLKPALVWKLEASAPAKLEAELAYLTGGMTWEADYNIVAPEKGDTLEVIGWVTIDNQSGKIFENAKIKLMAGDVSKIQPGMNGMIVAREEAKLAMFSPAAPVVTEKAFDEYHLYTLERPTTLRDRETKQVEFIRASGVKAQRLYVYDGLKLDENQFRGWSMENIRNNENFGTEFSSKVAVMREIKNSEANQLGIPLPKGRVRFYQQDGDRRLEFTGENIIDHTPKDETLRIYTGNAFDLVGERIRTDWQIDHSRRTAKESFKITLRNHKKEPVEIRVVEHLYRWLTWEIMVHSDPFEKTAAQVLEFRVPVKPDEEKVITYTVQYTW